MTGVSAAPASDQNNQPEKGADAPADLTKAAAPKGIRQSAVHSVTVPNLSGPQFERLARHAEAMGLDIKGAARELLVAAIEGPIEDTVRAQRDATIAATRQVKTITVDVETTRGKPKEKRTYLQVELDAKQRPYAIVWKALLHGFTDRFNISTLPPTDGLIPFCMYPDSPYDFRKMLIASKVTDNVDTLPVLSSDSLDVISSIEREQKVAPPLVYGLAPEKVARLIEKTQPVIEEINAQLAAAKAQNFGGISGIAMDDPNHPALSEQNIMVIGRLRNACEKLLKGNK